MKKLSALLVALAFALGACSTLVALAEPPTGVMTAEAVHQVLKNKPEWVKPAQDIAAAVMAQAGPAPTLDELESLARAEIDQRYASPEIRREGYAYVAKVRRGLETDLAANGALNLLEIVAWLATITGA